MAVLADRHQEFLDLGARVFAISADPAPQNAAIVEKLALPFPILADPDRDKAVTPLGFADEKDPRKISLPGTVIVDDEAEIVFSVTGRDYADRPDEDSLLDVIRQLDLEPTTQDAPGVGAVEHGPTAMPVEGLPHYLRGAKFATLALRRRYRDHGGEYLDDTKRYVQMVDRYIEAMAAAEERKT